MLEAESQQDFVASRKQYGAMGKRPVHNLVLLGFWAPGLAFMRRCNQAGVKVHLIDLLPNGETAGNEGVANGMYGGVLTWKDIGTESGLARLLDFAQRVDADAICTVDELSMQWLANKRDRFEPRCRVMASPAGAIGRLLEKGEQTKLAQTAGFQILDTWMLGPSSDLAEIPADAYPICIRPTMINTIEPSFKARKIDSPAELQTYTSLLTKWTGPLIAQPFHVGPNITVHAVRTTSGEVIAREAFRSDRKFRGFSLSIERYVVPEQIYLAAELFASIAEIDGPFHFDLLQDEITEEIYFLEVNFRMGGTSAKIVRLGFDEPMLTLTAYGLHPPQPPPPLKRVRRVTSKATLVAQIISVFKRSPDELAWPQYSALRTLGTAFWQLVTVPDALWSLRDLRGTISYLRRGRRKAF